MRSKKNTTNPKVSIIVPVYNEEIRVANLYTLHRILSKKKFIHECIVVNDGSTDTTMSQLKTIRKKLKIQVVSYKKNRGKGYAIKRGIEKAQGTHVIIIDIDLSTDMSAYDDVLRLFKKYNVIIGTRKNPKATLLQRQPWLRETMGKFFTYISQIITGVAVSDFTCGFKCYEISIAKRIAKKQIVHRWAYDNEYLYLAKKMGNEITEVPVIWKNDRKTKVRFPQDIIISFIDILRIRIADTAGNYNRL